MPDKKNQNQNQNQGQKNQGVEREQDSGAGRQQQGNKGQPGGEKGSAQIEREDVSKVGNPDLGNEAEDDAVTSRNPREGNEQGQRDMNRGGQDQNRDRNR